MTRKNRRGAATVETVVSMIALLPIIFYALFLEDLVYYKMENQEPTIVAGWDFTVPGYIKADGSNIGGLNRLKYCDHESAYDSFNQAYECDDGTHHKAMAAHQCWIIPGADQVRCNEGSDGIQSDVGKFFGTTKVSGFFDEYYGKSGSMVGMNVCTAHLGVMNYFLPQKMLNWGKDVTDKTRLDDGKMFKDSLMLAHEDAKGNATSANTWILTMEKYAIVSGSFSLLDVAQVSPDPDPAAMVSGLLGGEGNPIQARSEYYYKKYGQDAIDQANNYASDMKDYLKDGTPGANEDGMGLGGMVIGGDNIGTLPVYYNPGDATRSNQDGKASGGEDDRQGQNPRTDGEYPW